MAVRFKWRRVVISDPPLRYLCACSDSGAWPQSKDKLTAESIILSGFSTRDAGERPCLRDVDGVPVIEPSLLDLLRSVHDSIIALGDKFGHVKARTTAIEQRLADVEAVLLQRRARGEPPLEDALQLFERLKAEMAAPGRRRSYPRPSARPSTSNASGCSARCPRATVK